MQGAWHSVKARLALHYGFTVVCVLKSVRVNVQMTFYKVINISRCKSYLLHRLLISGNVSYISLRHIRTRLL